MSGVEPAVARAFAQAGQKLFNTVKTRSTDRTLRETARTVVPTRVVDGLLSRLSGDQVQRFDDYLSSPEFEEIALQYLVGRGASNLPWEELRANIRHEIRFGLRHRVLLGQEELVTAVDAVFDALTVSAPAGLYVGDRRGSSVAATATAAHVTAAAAANSQLLKSIGDLAEIYEFAEQLRRQVVALHGHMRLPHLGVSRSVPYRDLYVEPVLRPEQEGGEAPDPATLVLPGQRAVVLGDPGAGKSTLAAKLAHDVAADLVPDAKGRVPFLVVLREFAASFREGGRTLVDYLELVCRAPYNLDPPADAVEYLLGNGRAVVLLDGLDELVEPELRKRFVWLVDGFVARFPLVPVVVTARRIGYLDAPLDSRMFVVGVVAELNDDQVEQYVRSWFALDESTAVADRDRTARGFVTESAVIADLRANPLLLSLLCAMYAREHYIPANMAQVYERCAVMLFDRWDVMRGISAAPQFQGRLRAAVQHLAWQLFTAKESGRSLPRHRIVRLLADHLVAKQFDEDEAITTAETFVDFCTGRAWVLTDVGATETEPRYGFAHRTFLEFFAAEHLVRTNPTADRLFSVLRPHVLAVEWEVVAQIAVQLLDRNIDGGADDFLRLVLRDVDPQRWVLHTFAARTLRYVHPGHDVIREVTVTALRAVLEPAVPERFLFWKSGIAFGAFMDRDAAFSTLMANHAPGNLPAVGRAVAATLESEIEAGNDAALLAVMAIDLQPTTAHDPPFWSGLRAELRERHSAALAEWATRAPWPLLVSGAEPTSIITRFGVQPLYLSDEVLLGSRPTCVQRILNLGVNVDSPLWQALLAAPRPWIDDERWWSQLAEAVRDRAQETGFRAIPSWAGTPLVLFVLPYLEMSELAPGDPLLMEPTTATLHAARLRGGSLENLLREQRYPAEVAHFLTRWARREFDLVRRQDA